MKVKWVHTCSQKVMNLMLIFAILFSFCDVLFANHPSLRNDCPFHFIWFQIMYTWRIKIIFSFYNKFVGKQLCCYLLKKTRPAGLLLVTFTIPPGNLYYYDVLRIICILKSSLSLSRNSFINVTGSCWWIIGLVL
jgi:hypothetical protein